MKIYCCLRQRRETIMSDSVEIDGYGPQFSDEEITSLLALGWEETNAALARERMRP